MDKKLEEKLKIGYKRMAWFSIIWNSIFLIPLYLRTKSEYWELSIFLYFVIVFIGVRLSPYIINKIYNG